jgi:hypothetical protein
MSQDLRGHHVKHLNCRADTQRHCFKPVDNTLRSVRPSTDIISFRCCLVVGSPETGDLATRLTCYTHPCMTSAHEQEGHKLKALREHR